MQEIKNWLHNHQILPRISFKDRKEHIVEIVKGREESFNNDKDELVEGIKFLVKENGEPKTFFTASQDLLLKLADCAEGDIFKIKMCAKNVGGIIKSYFDISKIEGDKEIKQEIPVAEDKEPSQEEIDEMFGDDKK